MSALKTKGWAAIEEIPDVLTDQQAASSYSSSGAALPENWLVLPGNEHSIQECARDLFPRLAIQKELFYRGGVVVELIKQTGDESGLAIVDAPGFCSRIESVGRPVVWRSGANGERVLKPSVCSEGTAKTLLASREAAEHLPPITSVVNCPVCVEGQENTLEILGVGYHSVHGGVLVTAGDDPPTIESEVAVEELSLLLEEFDFQTDGDRSRALAQLITPAMKMGGLIQGFVPVDVAEADQSQSGKTYRQRLTAVLYNEQPRIIAKRQGGVGSVDESFSQALLAGRPFIQLDNFRGKLDSQFIESFLTASGSFAARVPHRGDVMVDPSRFILLLTSNGVETSEDMANRSCIVRIRKRAGHTFRTYDEGDLMAHVRAHQPYYLGCVFAVIKRWVNEGKPRTSTSEHDFRDWAQSLDWITQNIFQGAPLLEGHRAAQKRVSNPGLNFVRHLGLHVRENHRLGEEMSASTIFELAIENEIEIPGYTGREEPVGKRQVGTLMARLFKEGNPIGVDDFELTRRERETPRDDGGGKHMVKYYSFREAACILRKSAQGAQQN